MNVTYKSVWELPRNDIRAARIFWETNDITGEDWRVILRLQDDPAALIEAAKSWKKRSRPAPGA